MGAHSNTGDPPQSSYLGLHAPSVLGVPPMTTSSGSGRGDGLYCRVITTPSLKVFASPTTTIIRDADAVVATGSSIHHILILPFPHDPFFVVIGVISLLLSTVSTFGSTL
eukprot:GHVU01230309.1.p1 GENE.GHVU01230309.1~~GHVU01230309.1.p1  ORF type:complete len:110 (+),score=8.06 GHVU01230309.1:216-545(+)